jgi:hypothetical protein
MPDAGIFNGTRIKDNSTPDVKLQTISSAGKVANSATTATNLNTASAIVARDASGNFAAGLITASFSGDASLATNLNASNLASGTVPLARISGITNTEIAAGAAIVDTKLATISTAGKVANSATTATAAATASAIVARDGSGDAAFHQITVAVDPTSALQVATKQYVDGIATGLELKASVRAATTGALPANTRTGNVLTASANGALPAQDGVTLIAGDRILVKDEATAANNGIYTVTNAGGAGAAFVLTRSADADNSPGQEVSAGMFTFVEEGTTLSDTGWVLVTNNPITLNTTSLSFSQFSGAGQIVAGNGISKSGNTLSVLADAGDGSIAVTVSGVKVAANGISNSHIATNAAIVDTKLATISTAGKVANSATTGTASSNANTLALRDANGRTQFADPSAAQDAATKNYVDGKIAGTLVDNEVPTGTINGTNPTFTLAHSPISGSTHLNVDGISLIEGVHYTLTGSTLTYGTNLQPATGETHRISYRY